MKILLIDERGIRLLEDDEIIDQRIYGDESEIILEIYNIFS